jgi:saccharopine dehydrogenase (NAD+, L-lysine-forming)
MNIAVVGGAGLTGQCAVKDLLRSSKVSRVLVADNDEGSLAELKNNLKREGTNEKVEFSKTDVRNAAETSSKLRGFDVVINAVQYYHNLEVMEAALRAEVNYLDFGGLYYKTLEQIQRFDGRFKAAGLLAVVGIGAQPGISNLMVKQGLKSFKRADSVEILDGWRDNTKSDSPLYFTWSPLTLFDESTQDAIVFENGKYLKKPPFSEPETVVFPKPVGEVTVYLALHSELATVPSSFAHYGLKRVVWKEGGADFWKIKFLAELGLTSNERVNYNGHEVIPRNFLLQLLTSRNLLKIPKHLEPDDFEITRVIIKGRSIRSGRKKTVVLESFFPAYKPWKVSCSQYNVGIPGSIAAQLIALKKELLPKGVLPPEKVFEPVEFFKELEKRGIKVRQKTLE